MRRKTTAHHDGAVALEVRADSVERRKLSLRQIEVFRAVMLSGSVNGAAQMLGVSQPSLSRVIQRMADILGFELFERVKGKLVPTKEARALFNLIGRVYRELDVLSESVERIATGESELFRIGTTGSPGRCIVPSAIAALHRNSPKLSFHVDVLLLEEIIDYLLFQTGECVVSIFPVNHPLVCSKAIGRGRLVGLVPKPHPLARAKVLSVADLASEFLISFESTTPHGAIVGSLLAKAGLKPKIGVQIRHIETAIGLVAHRVGIAIVDEFAVADASHLPFAVVAIEGSPTVNVHLNWNREVVRSHFLQRLEVALAAAVGTGGRCH